MPAPNPQAPRPRRSAVRVALAVSLALNLLIAGLVAGAWLTGPGADRDRRPGLRDLGFGPFVQALPRADRRALAEVLRREGGGFRDRRQGLRRQFAAFLEALTAEPYDAARVEAIVAAQQEEVFAAQRLARDILLAHIAEMTPSERAAYAATLREAAGRGPWRQGPRN